MCHLKALEKKGLITREPNMSRAIQLTDAVDVVRGMPLLGQIAAGSFTEAIEQAERFEFKDWFGQKVRIEVKIGQKPTFGWKRRRRKNTITTTTPMALFLWVPHNNCSAK